MKKINSGPLCLGILLFVSGALLLGEQMGLIPNDVKWGGPLMFIFAGLSFVADGFKSNN